MNQRTLQKQRTRELVKCFKMSTFRKHFGLTAKDESCIFKELEKVRQRTRTIRRRNLLFKQRLDFRPPLSSSSEEEPPDRDEEERPRSSGGKKRMKEKKKGRAPWPGAQGAKLPATADLQGARRRPGKRPPFCPREFYMRSSAYRRFGPFARLPVIATQAGTVRPALLLRHITRIRRPRSKGPVAPVSKRVYFLSPAQESRLLDVVRQRYRQASSLSSLSSEADEGKSRRLRFHTHYLRQAASWARWPSRTSSRSPHEGRSTSQIFSPGPMTRSLPTSIEEIIASLQSEAQQAADQTIKELIESILGQNYEDIMKGISLVEQMHLRPTQSQIKSPTVEEDKSGQTSVKEQSTTQSTDDISEAVQSTLKTEQEDLLEWAAIEDENLGLKYEDVSEMVPQEDTGQPLETVKQKMRLSIRVRSSEILQIKGREIKQRRISKPVFKPPKPRRSVRAQEGKKLIRRIPQPLPIPHLHDLCNKVPNVELPMDLRLASRVYHTPDRRGHKAMLGVLESSLLGACSVDEQRDRILHGLPVMNERQKYSSVTPASPEKFSEPVQTSQQQAHQANLQLSGEEVFAYPGASKMFWNLTASKFAFPESVMRETLYSKFQSVQGSKILTEKISDSKESLVIFDTYYRRSFRSLIEKKAASYENIQKYSSAPYTRLKRSKSTVELREEAPPPFIVKDDVISNLQQLLYQKRKELERHFNKLRRVTEPIINTEEEVVNEPEDVKYLTLVEASRKAGISYIVYPKRRKKTKKKGIKFPKLNLVYEQLSKPPRKIQRSASHGILPGQKKHFLKVPLYERQIRCPSVPTQLNFDKFVQRKGGIPKNTNPLAWVIETFAKDKPQKAHAPVLPVQKDVPEIVTEIPKLELSDNMKCNLPEDLIAYYEAEVERLTQEINNEKQTPVFAYCRRGAIYRKLGKLQSAMNDLQETIFVEPMFLNAYWHRHFIYLFQDKFNDALDDLNFIHKYNKNHAEAYLSKAEIFKERKDFTLAILNYSQAIKCRPTDADLYFRRGELYEKTNKVLAMDDFSKCIHHDPQRADALMKRAMFYFENENWSGATSDFTSLIKLEPQNSQARTNRGRAYFKRHFYKQATEDFSVAIHLDPNNWLALYYRACLFRKSNPLRALQDYSVSALINDGYENLNCFLHRGILYTQLKHWMLAVSDFETVIFLERSATVAYINIGLVYLLHLDNYTEAFWWFSEAIRIDPLYIQSYLCRAETYHKLHTLKKAVNELSRAIHLQPDAIQLYIIRGQYLLIMKCFDLAKFTIYQVAEMNKGLIELTPVQEALTYSFCENHDKAIQVLEASLVNKPDIATFALLAKAQMKAKKIKESVRTFKKTLDMFSNPEIATPPTSVLADCLYNLGLCYMEEGNLHMAFDSFTRAVQANAELAEAFYYRGICKVKLNKENPILDFNRAITFNPKHYQAYLSRVAYYGLEGRYSKAILNCNEAIRLYPESVRAYISRGVLKCHNKNYKLAFTDLTTAINMDKNCYIAYYNRAVCYTKMRELQMALRDYGIVLLLNPGERITLSTFVNRGLIYNELKQYGFAIEDFKQAVLISQNNVNLCQATAMCHHRHLSFLRRNGTAADVFTLVDMCRPDCLRSLHSVNIRNILQHPSALFLRDPVEAGRASVLASHLYEV
nr:tetratricopeptide repeat protein 6 [Meriones unguiculatus]